MVYLIPFFQKNENKWKWSIIKDEWNDSMKGVGLMQNLIFFHLFDTLMQSLPKQKNRFLFDGEYELGT